MLFRSVQGIQGYTGSLGPQGNIGYTGSLGYSGSLGYTGSIGYTGSLGQVITTAATTPPSSPANGQLWWDSTSGRLKLYYADADTSQWVDATTGYVGYTGSNGGATGAGNDRSFFENDQSVSTSYSITAGKNAMTIGPITINSGVTVTVPSGQRWVVI